MSAEFTHFVNVLKLTSQGLFFFDETYAVPNLGTRVPRPYYRDNMQKSITSNKYRKLISWLKTTRIDQGLSMRDLAELIDEPHQFIGKIESCERRLDIYEYFQYCQALNIDPSEGLSTLK